jgi:hypothetical protein
MLIRELDAADWPDVLRIHADAPAKYGIPEFDSPLLVGADAAVDEDGKPRVVALAKRVAEVFLVVDHSWESPAIRLVALAKLHEALRPKLEALGYEEGYGFLGPDIPAGYDRRLGRLGWRFLPDVRCVKMLKRDFSGG